MTEALRDAKDQARLQCSETASIFAFRIYAILDATDLDYPDEDIRAIVERYHERTPFEPFDLNPIEVGKGEANLSHRQIVAGLEKIKLTRELTPEEVRKLNRNKKQIMDRGESERERALKATVLGSVLRQLVEDKLVFLH